VLVGITNSGKLGLGLVAGVFIVFALLSSFYFPRRDPNFPGNRLGLFTLITVLLFIVTMAGVIVFAKEEEEAQGAEAAETQPVETGEEPATTGEEPAATGEEPATTGEEPATTGEEPATTGEEPAEEPAGDAAAGEAVFSSAGCGSCHTLEAAGASGTVGPNLDEAKPDAALVVDRVTNGMGAMPSFKGQLDEQQIQDVAAYVVSSTQG
jgi:mono/diheme cytochrome c family protein